MTRIPSARRMGALAVLFVLAACGGEKAPPTEGPGSPSAVGPDGLTSVELEQGLGPIRDMELGELDPALAAQGETLFTMKCSACHRLGERYVGPDLGQILERRRPEFVMNMMLNANEMVQRHPVTKQLLAEFFTPMPVQVTDPDQARAILEYLRSNQTGDASPTLGSTGS